MEITGYGNVGVALFWYLYYLSPLWMIFVLTVALLAVVYVMVRIMARFCRLAASLWRCHRQ